MITSKSPETANVALAKDQQIMQMLKPWLDKTSPRSRRIAAGVVLALIFLVLVSRWHHQATPTYVLEILDEINKPEDVYRYEAYLTPQGKEILLWLFAKSTNKPSTSGKNVYSQPVIKGNTCDVSGRDEKGVFTIRLIKSGRWQFHDLYIDSLNNKPIELWLSEIKNHPIRTWIASNWQDVTGLFLKGFMIGAAGGGG